MASPDDSYLLGSRDEEIQRLGVQHRVWATVTQDVWRRAGFSAGAELADLGCGPGFTTLDLARLVGAAGQVLAIDSQPKFLAHVEGAARAAALDNVKTLESDIEQLELKSESLDGAYARWLFCFLPHPQRAVESVARALRPGARFAVTDYFNYRAFTFAPRNVHFTRVIEAVETFWSAGGGDLEVQGRMAGMMRQAGLEPVEVTQSTPVVEPGSPLWDWPRTFFGGLTPRLVEAGVIDAVEREAFHQAWAEREEDPDARLFLPPQVHVIAVKP